jgi:hypothetical protein
MYLDAKHLFSDAQALTATAASTNVVDLGSDSNLGIGEPMVVVVSLDVAADDANGDETYSVALQTDDNDSFSSAAELASRTITRGDAAGTKYVLGVPADTSAERYLRLNFTLGGTTPSATVTAFLIPQSMIQNYVSYPDGFTIS